MKVWFFYEEFEGSKGHWYKGYDAMIEHGGHMTCGTTLGETIFMAHDLVACLTKSALRSVEKCKDRCYQKQCDNDTG